MLITVLQMSHHGMKSIRIHSYEDTKTGQKESVVFMTGERIDLGHVVAKSGHVVGPKAQTMNIDGTRVRFGGKAFDLNSQILGRHKWWREQNTIHVAGWCLPVR